jgi:LacI family transcriptional regulator
VWLNAPVEDLPSVYPDCGAAGTLAAQHLLARGFRQFGYLGLFNEIGSRLQLEGFRGGVCGEDPPVTSHRFSRTAIEGKARGWDKFMKDLESWIDSWELPIGIFACHDLYARYLIDVCRSKGLQVSEDVAIVGTHNETDLCIAPSPTLTSIDTGFTRIGYRAARLLDELMQGKKAPAQPILMPPLELVPRQSTDAYAANDPVVARALRFIAEQAHERIAVGDVVAAVATNRRSLERSFRASVGRSIGGEITRLRIERAKRRMVETNAPMKDVALEAGFRNADHFYKVFVRVEGVPPTQYRDERQQMLPGA